MTILAILIPGLAGLGLWYWTGSARLGRAAAAVTLIPVLMGGLWQRGRQLEAAERDARAAALVRDSLEAAADTLRIHVLDSDSARTLAERRALQVAIERDSVDRLLRTETRVRARVEAQLASLDTTARAVVTTDSAEPGVRRAHWPEIRWAGGTVEAAVEVPPAPDSARIRLGLHFDPVTLTVRLGCEDVGREVRAARVSVEGPSWFPVATLDGTSDPSVCNPVIPPPSLLDRIRIGAPYAAGGLLVGAIGALILVRR